MRVRSVVLAALVLTVMGCGQSDLDELTLDTGRMEGALGVELDLEDVANDVSCAKPADDRYTCNAYLRSRNPSGAAKATYEIRRLANQEWEAVAQPGSNEAFPDRLVFEARR